jgi:4-diphosphocytidyl-2-C-methyl-D-erythritol kinase
LEVVNAVTYRSYGKINLYLDVLERRPDGFTNIETIFQTIDLWDELRVEVGGDGIEFTCSEADLCAPEENLVYRAAKLIRERARLTEGVKLHLDKRLPVAAGLAGGSGNAAAALIALNDLWSLGFSDEVLAEMALALGSDVPYCLKGGTVAATGRGEVMEALPAITPQWLVLVHPPLAITAGHAYGHPKLTRNLEVSEGGKTLAFREALAKLAKGDVAAMVFNRMESGVFHDHPELASIKARLRDYGCDASAMSGSGPTVFGLCADEASARSAGDHFNDYRVSVIRTAPLGVERRE